MAFLFPIALKTLPEQISYRPCFDTASEVGRQILSRPHKVIRYIIVIYDSFSPTLSLMSLVAHKYQKQVYALLLVLVMLQSISLAHDVKAHLFDAPLVAESCECELATFKQLFSSVTVNNSVGSLIVFQLLLATPIAADISLKDGFLNHQVRGPPNFSLNW